MPVAENRYFTKKHVEAHTFNASTVLAEQAIHCLELAVELADVGLSFQFKGGNSLLVILETPQRFSIDVDIATDETPQRIEQCLDALIQKHKVFLRWEKRQHKTKPWLPLSSYYLYYRSHFSKDNEPSVMLDAQLKRSPYKTERRAITCGEIYRCNVQGELPLPASIIGDKLLTMGPSTLGIPLGKSKEAQRLKHVYDVSRLLSTGPDIEDIRASFSECLKQENTLQGTRFTQQEVMRDTVAFCASVLDYDTKPDSAYFLSLTLNENVTGFDAFSKHLFCADYSWKQLQTDMARDAMCIVAVCTPSIGAKGFLSCVNGTATVVDQKYLPKSKLSANPQARYYWELLGGWLGGSPPFALKAL